MYSNKSNDLSPICTTNKDQLPKTPDVLKATVYFYSHNTQYVQNKTTIHLASTTTYKIYNIHKLHQSAPPQASGRQDPRGCPLRGWPHARHRGAARASLREWNIPLPYMVMCASMKSASRTHHSTNRRAIASHRGISPRTANGRSPNSHHRVPMTSTVPAAGISGPWSQNHDPLPLRQCLQIKKPIKSVNIPSILLRLVCLYLD